MENPVVIKMVSNGEKGYLGDYKGTSYPYSIYYTSKPFTDPNVQKFALDDALKIVKTQQIDSIFKIIQIIDAGGKIHYDNFNNRVVYKDKNKLRNLKNVVNEEVQRFLNESAVVSDDNFKFKQVIKHPNVFFYNYDNFSTDHDVDIINSVITVDWSVGFWVNDYGIENFFIRIEKIEGAYVLEFRDKQTDEVVQETQKSINDISWKFDVEDDVTLVTNGTLYIKDVSFDFKSHICNVDFYKQK